MPERFPRMKDGDSLTPAHLNIIYKELDRWRKLSGSGLIAVNHADSRDPPTIVDARIQPIMAADSGSGIPAGSRTSPSSATVTLLGLSSGGPGFTSTNGQVVTCYNSFPTAIPASKTVWLVLGYGRWYLLQAEC